MNETFEIDIHDSLKESAKSAVSFLDYATVEEGNKVRVCTPDGVELLIRESETPHKATVEVIKRPEGISLDYIRGRIDSDTDHYLKAIKSKAIS